MLQKIILAFIIHCTIQLQLSLHNYKLAIGHNLTLFEWLWDRRTKCESYELRDELISDVLLWTPTYGRAKAGRSARTYIQQLCEDTGCSPEDLPEAMNDREKWWERVRDIRASGTTWREKTLLCMTPNFWFCWLTKIFPQHSMT